MIDWNNCSVVGREPEILGGSLVFVGTRIPLTAVFENLEGGASIQEIIEWFPGLNEEYVKEILRFAAKSAAA